MIRPFRGKAPRLALDACVAPTAAVIGEDASLRFRTVARGDVHRIRVGRRTNVCLTPGREYREAQG